MPAALASSALIKNGYDLWSTVEVASKNGFTAVQLFINEFKNDDAYVGRMIQMIRDSEIKEIVIHFHNFGFITQKEIEIAERIENELPDRIIIPLVHYENDMIPTMVPVVNGRLVAIENAKTEVFDRDEIMKVYNFTRFMGVPMIFDHCRIMYPKNEKEQKEVIEFIEWFITNRLRPGYDVIHTADKTQWDKRFKDCWTYLGDPDGVCYPLLLALKEFSDKGGVVVFEHEDEDMAVKSLNAFQ